MVMENQASWGENFPVAGQVVFVDGTYRLISKDQSQTLLIVSTQANLPAASTVPGAWAYLVNDGAQPAFLLQYSNGTSWVNMNGLMPPGLYPNGTGGAPPSALLTAPNADHFLYGARGGQTGPPLINDGDLVWQDESATPHVVVVEGRALANGINHGLTQAKNFVLDHVTTGTTATGNQARLVYDATAFGMMLDTGGAWVFFPALLAALLTDDGTNLQIQSAPGAGGHVQIFGDGTCTLTVNPSDVSLALGDLKLTTAGKTISRKQGATAGDAVLVAGTKTVNTVISLAATDSVRLENVACGGTPGAVYISARTNGAPNTASITITSTNAADTSTIRWVVEHKG